MITALTTSGLATAAGFNAYIPLLALGLLDRFTPWVSLPEGWTWLSDTWMLIILGVLFVVELVADKIPGIDAINDIFQTLIRPAAGGITFASGYGADTVTVNSGEELASSGTWIAVIIGIVIALLIHLGKSFTRAAANTATVGVAAPVISTAEDGASVLFSAAAVFLPVLVIVLLLILVIGVAGLLGRLRNREKPRY
ncbi:DUF4126 domain-containing protein [Micrococcoides hystricis]|uniref:DUF4126 domain-containing protein n=1 Tax=Micrococcoides hystricis TaxID=1572761 RepID=A0ABV6P8S7_9MICC